MSGLATCQINRHDERQKKVVYYMAWTAMEGDKVIFQPIFSHLQGTHMSFRFKR
jgi:hypothetical protein